MRIDGRKYDELRNIFFYPNYINYPEGSVLVTLGNTKVICNATIEAGVPPWMEMKGVSGGWITGEYSLLPRSTHKRSPRESHGFSGRTQEIRRLIGRTLRSAVDLTSIGSRTCIIDCDVIQADGGTRSASISGGFLALAIALHKMVKDGILINNPIKSIVSAVSVGIVDGNTLLDLCYEEDRRAEVDFNITMNSDGDYIDVNGTAEALPFSRSILDEMLDLASKGVDDVMFEQKELLLKEGIKVAR